MTDAYGGRDSRRSNAPIGHYRRELVRVTKANELVLSGSPIQYFTHEDYQNADGRVTGACKMGIAGLRDHTIPAAPVWLDPDVVVSSVSADGYTITLTTGVDVGDLIEVFYYATGTGWRDATTPSQTGDFLAPETFDAMVQKLNDCPPLDWENNFPAMKYDISMCKSVVVPVENATTVVAQYTAVQVGTWQTTDIPFYVTAIHMGVDGANLANDILWYYDIFVDGNLRAGANRDDFEFLTPPANPGVAGYDQSLFIPIGLVECRSDLVIDITLPVGTAPTAWETNVAGWHS